YPFRTFLMILSRSGGVRAAQHGALERGIDHILDPHDPFYNSDLTQRSYDPDKASFYFKKAGVS
ncbi:hypothetical protein AB9E07_35855, partial [Rhizobium leguminosarum]